MSSFFMINVYLVINITNRVHIVSAFVFHRVFHLESTRSFMHPAPGVAQQGFWKSNRLLEMIPGLRKEVKWD